MMPIRHTRKLRIMLMLLAAGLGGCVHQSGSYRQEAPTLQSIAYAIPAAAPRGTVYVMSLGPTYLQVGRNQTDASGARFFMRTEQSTAIGPMGALHRVSLTDGIKEVIPDVMSYVLAPDGQTFHYRKYLPGSLLPELHLRDLAGRDRNLGRVSAPLLRLGTETVYFLAEAERTLTRTSGFDGPIVALRGQVARFLVGGDERQAILEVTDQGTPRALVLDLNSRSERPLPVAQPCCWIGLLGKTFVFADRASADKPAELHHYDIETGTDRVVTLPAELVDAVAIMTRPPGRQEFLIQDSTGRIAVYRPEGNPVVEPLSPAMAAPAFSPDGRHLLFVSPEPGAPPTPPLSLSGPLYARSADDWSQPPRLLSPAGTRVPIQPRGYLVRDAEPDPLVFWAQASPGVSDLYLGDHQTGASRLVARAIGVINLRGHTLIGVVNVDPSGLGDLVQRNLQTDKELLIEHGVADVAFQGNRAAFVVRDPTPGSPRNGLWATMLPDPDS